VDKLVYYEEFDNVNTAIAREKQLKAGSRENKIKLIDSMNPDWRDLYDDLV
jgi:putative endonuclease